MLTGPVWLKWVFTVVFAVLAGYSMVRVAALTRSSRTAVLAPVSGDSSGAVNPVECGCSDQTAGERASSLAHAVMALAMAAMFLPVPLPVSSTLWIVLFAAMAAWFAAGLLRARSQGGLGTIRWTSVAIHHLVGSLAMIYMSVMMLPGSGMAGMAMGGMDMSSGKIDFVPVITTPLLLYFVADTVASARRLSRASPGSAGALGSARLLGTCRTLMSLGMTAMLVASL
jgi:hypothetical protein